MGLFINKTDHPGVFQHNGDIQEPNQSYYKTDYFSDLIKEQRNLNESLTKGIKDLKNRSQQFEITEARKWTEIASELQELKRSSAQHEKFEHKVQEWLQMLESNNQELQRMMENDGEVKQEMMDQMNHVSESNQEIVNQLANHESFTDQLTTKMNDLFELHQQISEQLSEQDNKQDQVLNSFENQEALMEKTFRQVDHIRTILFERTSHLAEKIEDSYNLTSSLLYKLLSGSERPLTLMMTGKKRENKKENAD